MSTLAATAGPPRIAFLRLTHGRSYSRRRDGSLCLTAKSRYRPISSSKIGTDFLGSLGYGLSASPEGRRAKESSHGPERLSVVLGRGDCSLAPDQALCLMDGRGLEPGEPPSQGVHEGIKLVVGEDTVDPAIALRSVCVEVVTRRHDLERGGGPDKCRQALDGAARGEHADTNLGLSEDRLRPGETKITREGKFVTAPTSPPTNRGDGDRRCPVHVAHRVDEESHSGFGWSERYRRGVGEVIARHEELGVLAREDHDIEFILLLDQFHQCGKFNDCGRVQQVDGRVGVDHLPIAGGGFTDLEEGQAADVWHHCRPFVDQDFLVERSAI